MEDVEPFVFSTGDLAVRFGVPLPTIVLVVDRLGVGTRVGRARAIRREDVGKVEAALIGGGYLQRAQAVGA